MRNSEQIPLTGGSLFMWWFTQLHKLRTKTWLIFYRRLCRLAKLGSQSAIFTIMSTYRKIVVFQFLAYVTSLFCVNLVSPITSADIAYRIHIVFKVLPKGPLSNLKLSTQLGSDRLPLPEILLSGCEQFLCIVTCQSYRIYALSFYEKSKI